MLDDPKPKKGRSNPLVVDSLVIFHGSLQKLYAIDGHSGKIAWSHDLDDKVTTQLTLVGDLLAFGTESKRIVYVSTADGTTVRENAQPLLPRREMNLHDGRMIYLAGQSEDAYTREVAAVDPDDGSVHWMLSLDAPPPALFPQNRRAQAGRAGNAGRILRPAGQSLSGKKDGSACWAQLADTRQRPAD